ncbi:PEP-CTERM sorting domain-containing protein [Microcystis aeruginosa]|uniref:PEP-CTERM sorting domain-containing protein n=1 Tax=Microcystis aeruginosa TaxID=1126 RepID=UPI002330AD77|nr:PEP-CTERM sorting domain-containing protein [Microcystis aeruginosa]MDB9418679.1 PEP-CTERM sorting domain-containing protein [Microcystis aeruginosa CS-556/03]
MNKILANCISLGIGLGAIGVAFQAQAAPFFTGLGFLPGGSFSRSFAHGVSADGSVVVGRGSSVNSPAEAFRWTQGTGMVGLGFLPGGGPSANLNAGSTALGISADGSVVVGYSNIPNVNGGSGGYEAFRWTQATGMVGLGDLPGGIFDSKATGVSADGSVVVGNGTGFYGTAFRWTQATGMVGLGYLPGGGYYAASSATGVSANGSVVVGNSTSANGIEVLGWQEAFRWTQGTGMVGLGDLPGGIFWSSAQNVSADGSVVVGQSSGAYGLEAFRWTQGTGMIGLGSLPGGLFVSAATGVSADGSVIVGYSVGGEVFVWNSTQGMRSLREILTNDYGLDLTGWGALSYAGNPQVSADGLTIVGQGWNPNGNLEAWIARLNPQNNPSVPEPSSILGLGLFSLVGFLRKKRS